MDPKYLNTLEFPKIRQRLASHTSFSASHALAQNLLPATELEVVRERHCQVTEAIALIEVNPGISIGGARDVRPYLEDARRQAVLLPEQLLEIKATLASGRSLKKSLSRMAAVHSRLAGMASKIEECSHVISEISRCLDERGEVLDSASLTLTRIRRELRSMHGRILERLNRILTSPNTAGFLQEALVTQRRGRYVIPLKSEHKGRIPGLVHDQSGSGATLFIEPFATVELNNQLRTLQIDEENEVRRILADLTGLVAEESDFIEGNVVALAEIDLAFARAKYAREIRGISPILTTIGHPRRLKGTEHVLHPNATIDVRGARHPLLNPETVVPIDAHLGSDYFVLVITGPNTGGKTVTLKTVGLLIAMCQAGLPIPVEEGSRLSVFEAIYADIGDEQSIEQSLSTFSSHMTNIVSILQRADSHSLVLLDELGAGTDPEEGSALARALLSHLVSKSITALATTHYSELKIFAHSAPGVQNASVEFDVQTLSPTYELTIGLPGRSNAFAIARRLGLPDTILQEATGMVSIHSLEAEDLLAELKRTQQAAVEERRLASMERQEASLLRGELTGKLQEVEAARLHLLEEAKAQARREVETVREEIERLRAQARQAIQTTATPGETMQQFDTLRTSIESLQDELQPVDFPEPSIQDSTQWVQPRVGDTVWVRSLDILAEVILVHEGGEEVDVQAGAFHVRVPAGSVLVRHQAPKAIQPMAKLPPSLSDPVATRPSMELDVRGLRAEEALLRLEKYLDDAFLSNLPWVRVIHGKGTGALRQAVRGLLNQHPQIASFRAGDTGEGGDGVTIVTLRSSSP